MKIRLVGTPEEAEQGAALIAAVMTIVEDSGDRARRGGGLQVQRYLDVRLPPAPESAPARPRRARPSGPDAPGPEVDLSPWA
ncbi:hypothetical protein ACIBKY_51390 [Nonomuraea sp. NPDC050394]|uniref:hypothetical protein n=1 Tax=Nonomuraea sp. NPDC050394 TaxID=3364363 RepID=UPI00379C420A